MLYDSVHDMRGSQVPGESVAFISLANWRLVLGFGAGRWNEPAKPMISGGIVELPEAP